MRIHGGRMVKRKCKFIRGREGKGGFWHLGPKIEMESPQAPPWIHRRITQDQLPCKIAVLPVLLLRTHSLTQKLENVFWKKKIEREVFEVPIKFSVNKLVFSEDKSLVKTKLSHRFSKFCSSTLKKLKNLGLQPEIMVRLRHVE